MTIPMAEGPPDGDFARYVERLTAGSAHALGAHAVASAVAPSGQASAREKVRADKEAAARTLSAQQGAKGGKGVAQAGPGAGFKARFSSLLFWLVVVAGITWYLEPRLTPVALFLVVVMFVVSLLRALARSLRNPS